MRYLHYVMTLALGMSASSAFAENAALDAKVADAVRQGDLTQVMQLHGHEALNAQDAQGYTPLILAIYHHQLGVA